MIRCSARFPSSGRVRRADGQRRGAGQSDSFPAIHACSDTLLRILVACPHRARGSLSNTLNTGRFRADFTILLPILGSSGPAQRAGQVAHLDPRERGDEGDYYLFFMPSRLRALSLARALYLSLSLSLIAITPLLTNSYALTHLLTYSLTHPHSSSLTHSLTH